MNRTGDYLRTPPASSRGPAEPGAATRPPAVHARRVTGRPNLAHARRGKTESGRKLPACGARTGCRTGRGHVAGRRRTHQLTIDTRTSLLDALRERLGNTSPKKGCDHGQCGACTVLLDGERVLSCLALAVAHDGAEVRTADGLTAGEALHPVQQAFIDHDAFQCGYCTPGQICSAVGMLQEAKRGWPSHVTADLAGDPELTDAEIAERSIRIPARSGCRGCSGVFAAGTIINPRRKEACHDGTGNWHCDRDEGQGLQPDLVRRGVPCSR